MTNDIEDILKKLHINKLGNYDNHFYIIQLADSEEYAKMFSLLDEYAINTEYPVFSQNTSKNTTKIVNYFETEENGVTYNIFLIANFDDDTYYLKIGEKLGA